MGFFTRLRSSSTANLPLGSPSTADLHDRPRPSTPAASSAHLSPHLPSFSRSSHPPSSPSASSVASRISKRPWKWRADDSLKGSQKGKGKSKGKEREEAVAEDDVAGPRYDDFSPVPPVSALSLPRVKYSGTPDTKGSVTNPPLLNLGEVSGNVQPNLPLSPLSRLEMPFGENEEMTQRLENEDVVKEIERRRKSRLSSAFGKEGGILGKLNFETGGREIESGGGDGDNNMLGEPWRERNEMAGLSPVPLRQAASFNDTCATSDTTESAVFVDSGNETPERTEEVRVGTPSPGRFEAAEEDPMEVLESAEKKTKFWKSKGRGRRQSRATSIGDMTEFETFTTSTTAIDIPNSSRNSVDIVHPRPQALRRPSSSLFINTFNPFTRSVSRASERSPVIDDGSFQLRGFRHVSGMSDVEGAGELEGYLTHVKRESVLALDKPGTPTPGEAGSPPVAHTSQIRTPTKGPIPRPASAANSITSMDELVSQSNRMSVAAFRRGIRRPSEGVATMSDLGHGMPPGLDDDDVPLGVRKTSYPLSRKQSSLSLSSGPLEAEKMNKAGSPGLKQLGDGIERKDSPLSFQVKPYRNPGTGFFVKRGSPQSQQDVLPPDIGYASPAAAEPVSELRPALFATPPSTRGPSPNTQAMGESDQIAASPVDLSPVDSYFMGSAPVQSDNVRKTPGPVPLNLLRPRPDYGQHAFPSPLSTGQQAPGRYSDNPNTNHTPSPVSNITRSRDRPPPPPVAPLNLPSAEDPLSSLALNLPLPPDQMPDTPPKALKPLSELPSRHPGFSPDASTSPNSRRKRMSLLDEPMRIISGLWGSPTGGEDGFDPALVASSMRMYGEDAPALTKDKEKEEQVALPTPATGSSGTLEHQRSPSTVPDMGTATSLERIRSPLSERLAGVANWAKMSNVSPFAFVDFQTPTLDKIQTEKAGAGAGASADQDKTPVGDSTAAGRAGPILGSSFIPRASMPSKELSSESENEGSDTEGENNPSANHQQHLRQHQQPLSSTPRNSNRRVPSGPRKPSLSNRHSRIVSMPSINSQSLQPGRPSAPKAENSDSEDDQPLSVVKTRSRSFLTVHTTTKSPPFGQAALPSPAISAVTTTNVSSKSSPAVAAWGDPRIASRPLVEMGRVVSSSSLAAPRDGSILESRSSTTLTSSSATSTPASAKASLPSPVTRTQVRFASPEKSKNARKKTASPESVRSGTTGGSGFYRPLTQMSGEMGLGLRVDPGNSQNEQRGDVKSMRQSQGNMPPTSPVHFPAQLAMQQGHQQGMQQNMQNVSPEAMQYAMKQQWQMNIVAAALRASEEEWERQSSTSTGTSSTTPNFNGAFPMPLMPMFPPMNMGMMNPNVMGLGMGMGLPGGYGYTQPPGWGWQPGMPGMPGMHGMHFGGMGMGMPGIPGPGGGSGGGGGGYTYSLGAQSAYGGNFGPPLTTPSQQRHATHTSSTSTVPHSQGDTVPAPSSRITSTYLPPDSHERGGREVLRQRSASAMGTTDGRAGFTGLLAEREKAEVREMEEAQWRRDRDERELQRHRVRERGVRGDGEAEVGGGGRRDRGEVSPPPSSWGRAGRTASGEWSEEQGTPRKARPRSQFAN